MPSVKGDFYCESNVKVRCERGCVIHVHILAKYPTTLLRFSQTRLLLYLKMLLDMRTLSSRIGYRILSTTTTMLFLTKVNSWKSLTILINNSTSDVAGILNPPLTETCATVMFMVLDWK